MRVLRLVLPLLLCVLWLTPASAQAKKIRVAVTKAIPFVIGEKAEDLKGYDIDLWEAITKHLGWAKQGTDVSYEYVVVPSFHALLESVEKKKADIAIAGVTISEDRELRYDFSYPYIDSGLAILLETEDVRSESLFSSIWNATTSRTVVHFLLIVLLFIIGSAHVIWWAERGSEAFHDNYFPGILEGCWWAVVTMTTVGYGDKVPNKWVSRVAGTVIMVVGIMTFSAFTAVIASSMTIREFKGRIRGPEDFNRYTRAGCVRDTTSEAYLQGIRARVMAVSAYETLDKSVEALKGGAIDCVIFDVPMLRYIAKNDPSLTTAPRVFAPQKYGILMELHSRYRKDVNRAILKLERDGSLAELKQKYFPE